MLPIGYREGIMLAQQPAGEVQVDKMGANQDDSVACCERLFQIFHAFIMHQRLQLFIAGPPTESQHEQADTGGFEILLHQPLLLRLRELGKADRNIYFGDMSAPSG